MTFICDHPDIQAISFVGSDRAVRFRFLSSVTAVVHVVHEKCLRLLIFVVLQICKPLKLLTNMDCLGKYWKKLLNLSYAAVMFLKS